MHRQKDEKYAKNKFVQEMIAQSEEMENEKDENEQRMNDLMHELIKKGMKEDNAKKFINYLAVHQYDSDAIKYDVEQRGMFNQLDQSNLFDALDQNKYFIKVIRNHFKIKGNDNDKIAPFSFGEKIIFLSWQYYKGWKYFVVPKYGNLKKELLNNGICAMNIELFNRQLSKAHIFASSEKGKTIKANHIGGENKLYGVPPCCPISVAHILCALIYCNCTNVQYKFKKYGTRKHKYEQRLEELRELNAEINWWYSLLFECVSFFGSETKAKDIFYTGLNIPLLFDSFVPRFTAPISTTVDIHIATQFSKGTGVILKMKQGAGRPARYFNVEWLSNFEHERERLFFYVPAGGLRIVDIYSFHDAKKFVNSEAVRAMTLFSSLFAGHYLLDLLNKRTQKMLYAFIQCFKANNNLNANGQIIKNQFSLFMEQLFFNLVHNMEKMIVIKQEYEKLSEALKNELLLFEENPSQFVEYLIKTNEKKIEFMEEFIWIFNVEQINALKYGQKDEWFYSGSFYYDLPNDEKVEFKTGLRNDSSDKYTWFQLTIVNAVKPLDGVFSICVDDFAYIQNSWPFYKISLGQSKLIFCFEEKYLEKIVDSLAFRVAVLFK